VQRRRVTILVYHDPAPDVLERHLDVLCQLYRVVSLSEYVASLNRTSRAPLPARALVVTFDDGHATNFALRDLFRRFGVRPTIFVCTGVIGTRRGFWFRHVADAEALKRLPDVERRSWLAAAGFDADAELSVREALSNEEIEELAAVADIQAHTVTHPILPRCTREHAEAEVTDSKLELERRFGFDVYALAYPNGEYTEREVSLASAAGYRCAVGVGGRTNRRATDTYSLGRIAIDDRDGVDELVVKASGLWGLLERGAGRSGGRSAVLLRAVVAGAVVAGLVFRLAQYLANRSLWFDESQLALNILDRSLWGLGHTLELNQAAPIGFLWLEKLASDVFGSSEYALRLLPLLCGLASVVLFAAIARRMLEPPASALATVLFACAAGPIYYASEVKQYSGDLAATLALLLLGDTLLRGRLTRRRAAAFAVTGALVIPLSHPSVFVAGGVSFVLFVLALRGGRKRFEAFAPTAVWLATAALVVLVTVSQTHDIERLIGSGSDVYVVSSSSSDAWLHWLRSLASGITRSLGYQDSGVGPYLSRPVQVVAVVGLVSLAFRRPAQLALLVAPVGVLAVASAVHKYPLFDRTVLFLVPAAAILAAEGVHAVATRLPAVPARRVVGGAAAAALVALPAAYAAKHLVEPRQHEEIKQGLAYIGAHRRPGDTFFVDYDAQFALRYYRECGCLPAKNLPTRLVVGRDGDRRAYLQQFEALAGRPRVWVLYTHTQGEAEAGFLQNVIGRLDRRWRRLAGFDGVGVHVYLYDLRRRAGRRKP
jgi:peptidoglycan/xylan/chitin deacetylase (PgdA/CDA1 family)